MNSGELKRAKREARKRALEVRDAIPAERRGVLGAAAIERFLALPEVGEASTVMAFWSFGSELPTLPLIEALHDRGARVALPRIVEGEIEPRAFAPGDPTTEAAFGALEPSDGAIVEPHDIDVIATPAVAFDRRGQRVGYGGGFYDRFFARARSDALRVGIALGPQLLDPELELPAGAFDLPVDVVVTEAETVRFRRDR